MNVVDKTVAFFSPEAGLRRACARQLLDQTAAREYAAAGSGRRNAGWRGRNTSAATEVSGSLTLLMARSREFVRNSWQGQRILDVLTSHVIGTGIMTVPNTGSDRIDRIYRLAREEWEENSDIEGVLDYGGQQAMAVRSMAECGNSIIRHLTDSDSERRRRIVPLRLQGIEGDQIDTARDTLSGVTRNATGERVRLGVKLGEWNQRQGMYLHKTHPGEQGVANIEASTLVEWGDLCHLYRPLRFGQLLGVPVFAPILMTGRDIQDLMDAAIVQQKVQASFAGFLRRAPGEANPFATEKTDGADGKPQTVTQIRPGQIQDIGDSEIVFSNPSGTSVFGEAYLAGMMAMAAGAGLTYDQLTGDLRQANYSSLRAGKIEFRRLVEQMQWHMVVPMICRPVDRKFEQMGLMSGVLPRRKGGYRVDYVMPAVEPIDPKKDLEADILAVRSGRMSPQEFISAWGRDWRKVVTDFDAFFSFCDQNALEGLMFDIDPRRPANGGATAPRADQTGATDNG